MPGSGSEADGASVLDDLVGLLRKLVGLLRIEKKMKIDARATGNSDVKTMID